jgi:hypothetical protein
MLVARGSSSLIPPIKPQREEMMLKFTLIQRGAAMVVAAFVIAGASQAAFAMPKEQGTYDCSCKGGKGSCTFKSSDTEISCYHGAADTCDGSCQLKSSPNGGSAARGSVKGGPIGTGGTAATH